MSFLQRVRFVAGWRLLINIYGAVRQAAAVSVIFPEYLFIGISIVDDRIAILFGVGGVSSVGGEKVKCERRRNNSCDEY
jgi:hypothetical protein